jgi:hypothetical protein
LVFARARAQAPPLRWVPLMTLWANLHGGFMVGVALAWLLGAEAVLEGPDRARAARRWGIFALAATLAAMVTPNFPQGFLLPFRFLAMGTMFSTIAEWRSPDFQNFDPLEVTILAALLFGFWRGFRMPPFRLVLVLGLVWSAFQHIRNEVLVGIAGMLLVAEALGRHLASRPFRGPDEKSAAGFEFAIAAPTLVGLLGFLWLHPVERGPDAVTPSSALDHLPAELRDRPVFNQYVFGGYLIYVGVKPFIDGRTDMYPPELLRQYTAVEAGDAAARRTLFERYKIAWCLLAPASPLAGALAESPEWRRVYADDVAVLEIRADTPAAD